MNSRLRELDHFFGVAVTMDASDVQLAVSRVAKAFPEQAGRLAALAQRKALTALRQVVVTDLREETTLDRPVIAKAVRTRTPKNRHGLVEGAVRVATTRLPLIRYARGITPLRVTAERGKRPQDWQALSYRLERKGKQYDNDSAMDGQSRLFIAKMRSGHVGVFSRLFGSLSEETGPSAQFFVASDEKRQRYDGILAARFLEALDQGVPSLGGRP